MMKANLLEKVDTNSMGDKTRILIVLTALSLLAVTTSAQMMQHRGSTGNLIFENSGGDTVLNISEDGGLTNLFEDTDSCGASEAVKNIYSNGTYNCVGILTDQTVDGLSAVLTSDNTANQSIDMNGNNILGIGALGGDSGSITLIDSLDMAGNVASGIGELQFDQGVEIGGSGTATGGIQLELGDNLTVDSTTKWNQNSSSIQGVVIQDSELSREIVGNSFAERFDSNAYGATVEAVAIDSNGEVYVGGGNDNVMKLDSAGTEQWTYNYDQTPNDIEVDSSQNVYLAGSSNYQVSKLDSAGTEQWTYEYGFGNFPYAVAYSNSGNVYAGGAHASDKNVVKLVDEGSSFSESWTFDYGGDIRGIAVDSSKIYAAGTNNNVVKLVDNGGSFSEEWSYSYGATIQSVAADSNGNVYVAGNNNDVVKLVDNGGSFSEDWSYNYGDTIQSIDVDSSGNVYVGGNNNNLVRLSSSSGNEQWSYSYGSTINGVAVNDSKVALGGSGNNVVSLNDTLEYADPSVYESNTFDLGTVKPIRFIETRSTVLSGTEINVTVRASNNSDMSASSNKKIELDGGDESTDFIPKARYVDFNVSLGGSETKNPSFDRINIAVAGTLTGEKQTAVGKFASTKAEGATAIGYKSVSDEDYTVGIGSPEQNYDLMLHGTTITDQDQGNVTVGQDLKVEGDVYSTGADLAEIYSSHQKLEKGELVMLSDRKEVERTEDGGSDAIGVVSTDPGSILNADQNGYPIALEGKVPVKVNEKVEQGDYIVPSGTPGVAASCSVETVSESLSSNSTNSEIVEAVKGMESNQGCLKDSIGTAMETGSEKVEVKLE
jgi:hypothetical protein